MHGAISLPDATLYDKTFLQTTSESLAQIQIQNFTQVFPIMLSTKVAQRILTSLRKLQPRLKTEEHIKTTSPEPELGDFMALLV